MTHNIYMLESCRLFREGTRILLDSFAFNVVGVGESLTDISKLPDGGTSLLFIVGTIEGATASDAIMAILDVNPRARIVVLADSYDAEAADTAVTLGAKGYLHKGLSADNFIKALQLVADECSVVSGSTAGSRNIATEADVRVEATSPPAAGAPIATALDDGFALQADVGAAPQHPHVPLAPVTFGDGRGGLSPRQKAILKLVTAGASNKEIARNLDISEGTVKVHIKAILRRIAVKNRTQAAIWALAAKDALGIADTRKGQA